MHRGIKFCGKDLYCRLLWLIHICIFKSRHKILIHEWTKYLTGYFILEFVFNHEKEFVLIATYRIRTQGVYSTISPLNASPLFIIFILLIIFVFILETRMLRKCHPRSSIKDIPEIKMYLLKWTKACGFCCIDHIRSIEKGKIAVLAIVVE